MLGMNQRRPSRYRIQAPVHEDSKLLHRHTTVGADAGSATREWVQQCDGGCADAVEQTTTQSSAKKALPCRLGKGLNVASALLTFLISTTPIDFG